jgi:hypothetical protein
VTLGSLVQSHASDECFEDGAQGWNIDQLAGPGGPVVQYGCTRAAGTGRERCWSASAHCWVLRERASRPSPRTVPSAPPRSLRCGAVVTRVGQLLRRTPGNSGDATSQDLDSRPYLENCTVDASIKYFVAKLVRAHGGCLGTRSR